MQNMMDVLKLSCIEVEDMDCDRIQRPNPYLEMDDEALNDNPVEAMSMSEEEKARRIKDLFSQLVSEGKSPKEAVLIAIKTVVDIANRQGNTHYLLSGGLKGIATTPAQELCQARPAKLKTVLWAAKKYVENVQKKPYSPKVRCLKISNAYFDTNISSIEGGLEYLANFLGLRIYCTSTDFFASIPLSIDIDTLRRRIEKLLAEIDV